MKNHLSGRKQFLAFALAAVFALGTAVPVLAESGILDGPYTQNMRQIDVTAVCDAPTYCIELSWNNMEFHYQYGKGWDYESYPEFNSITMENLSDVPVAVKMDFQGNSGYTGTFNTNYKGEGDSYKALYLSAKAEDREEYPKGTVYLILNEQQPANPTGQNVGSITLTLCEVVANNGSELITECDNANIGYVTSASELVPFTEKDQHET